MVPEWQSDSGSFDAVLELLVHTGRELPETMVCAQPHRVYMLIRVWSLKSSFLVKACQWHMLDCSKLLLSLCQKPPSNLARYTLNVALLHLAHR